MRMLCRVERAETMPEPAEPDTPDTRQPPAVAPSASASQAGGTRSLLAFVVMCVAVIAVYFPIRGKPTDNTQEGGDFHYLHARRMDFAREHLTRDKSLPGWYPREFMGTPFWSNVQNFPFIPTRLALLPVPKLYVYTAGVILSAVLAAAFTFGYARAIGLGPV